VALIHELALGYGWSYHDILDMPVHEAMIFRKHIRDHNDRMAAAMKGESSVDSSVRSL